MIGEKFGGIGHKEAQRAELADFLKTRRARLRPEQLGLPQLGRRRTPGLRREEVAQLAGIGLSWYTWLEQGRAISVSDQLLESLAKTLQLNETERQHLFRLAQGMLPVAPENKPGSQTPLPVGHQAILDGLGSTPAYMVDEFRNVVGWNKAACAVFGDFELFSARERNAIWALFMSPARRDLYLNWEQTAQQAVRTFRLIYDTHAGNTWFTGLIEELKAGSPEFRKWWVQHNIQEVCDPIMRKEFNHPLAGYMEFASSTLVAPDSPGYTIIILRPQSAETQAKMAEMLGKVPAGTTTF